MKKAFSAAGCLLLGALAAWALPLTMALREPIEALTNSTALLLVALAFALLIRRAERSGCLGVPEMIMGVLFSAMLVLGSELCVRAEHAFTRARLPYQAAAILSLSPVIASLLALTRQTLAKRSPARGSTGAHPFAFFLAMWAFIALCYLPAWLAYFPAITSYDTGTQLSQIASGEYVSNHPLLHTGLLTLCIRAGGGGRMGVALYAFFQLLCLSSAFAYACFKLRVWGAPRMIWGSAALYFALWPTHALLAVAITKDVLFSVLFLLATLDVIEMLRDIDAFFRLRLPALRLTLSLMALCLLRPNGIEAVLALSVGLVIVFKGKRCRMIALCAAALSLYGLMNMALGSVLQASKGNGAVMLSVPAQQIAAAVKSHPERIDNEELGALGALFDAECFENYLPFFADPVKDHLHMDVLAEDPVKYAQVYLSIGRKCPGTYLSAALALNSGLWYPDNAAHANMYMKDGVGYVETIDYFTWPGETLDRPGWLPRVHAYYEAFASDGVYRRIGVLSILFAPGIYTWLLIASTFLLWRMGRRRAVVALLPCWGLVPVLLLGPVINVRYVYPMMAAAPVMLALLIGNPLKQEVAS